jgi:hypothetical protein
VSPPGWSRAPDWLDSRYRRDCDDAAQAAARACEHQRAGPAVLNTPAPYDQVQQAEPYPDDTQGWLRWVETLEAPGREMLSALTPPDHRLARTEVELDGVRTYTLRPNHVAEDSEAPIYSSLRSNGSGPLYASPLRVEVGQERRQLDEHDDHHWHAVHFVPGSDDALVHADRRRPSTHRHTHLNPAIVNQRCRSILAKSCQSMRIESRR